jgi:hypothetical protein
MLVKTRRRASGRTWLFGLGTKQYVQVFPEEGHQGGHGCLDSEQNNTCRCWLGWRLELVVDERLEHCYIIALHRCVVVKIVTNNTRGVKHKNHIIEGEVIVKDGGGLNNEIANRCCAASTTVAKLDVPLQQEKRPMIQI